MPNSKKAAFLTGLDPRFLIDEEKRKRPWMKHSVAVVIVSPRADQIVLAQPKTAVMREAEHVCTLPQLALGCDDTVKSLAVEIANDLLQMNVRTNQAQYLGSARGNAHSSGIQQPYGKWIHFVGVRAKTRNGLFNIACEQFQSPSWWHTNALLETGPEVMSERKYLLTLQALAAFNALGTDGQLTRRAKERLAA